jgi:hypothetical protein
VFEVLELRAYQRARDAVNAAKKQDDIPDTPMAKLVLEIQADRIRGR